VGGLKLRSKKNTKIISVVNSKGGVGKSTLAIQLSIAFSKLMNFKVLLVDLDDQGSSLNWFNMYREDDSDKISACHLASKFLRKQLKKVSDGYDLVILDSKGSRDRALGDKVSVEAILNSDYTIIPVVPTAIDDLAASDFVEDIIQPLAGEEDLALGILLSKTTRSKTCKYFKEEYRKNDHVPFFQSEIPDSKQYDNCLSHGLACFEYKPNDMATRSFLTFFQELCENLGYSKGKNKILSQLKKVNLSHKSKNKKNLHLVKQPL
tara:strand:+ start:943 stop:1734 length:792 start_codon:yes stop_codon:yes gene_type:complete